MDLSLIFSVWTVVLFLIFVGILGWVFVIKRRSDFLEAARIPLDDDLDAGEIAEEDERGHG